MLIQRTVEKLRERPEHERAAVAASIAIGVVLILIVGWVAVFLHGFGSGGTAVATNPSVAITPPTSSTAVPISTSPVPALQWQASATNSDASLPATSSNY